VKYFSEDLEYRVLLHSSSRLVVKTDIIREERHVFTNVTHYFVTCLVTLSVLVLHSSSGRWM